MIVNNELERMRKEVAVAKLKGQSWHLPGGTEENHKKSLHIASLQAEI
jgi:hypothetical protein